jgi:hypothetical protein
MTLPATAAAAASRVFTLSRPTSYSPGRNLARGHPSHDESGNSDFEREREVCLFGAGEIIQWNG